MYYANTFMLCKRLSAVKLKAGSFRTHFIFSDSEESLLRKGFCDALKDFLRKGFNNYIKEK